MDTFDGGGGNGRPLEIETGMDEYKNKNNGSNENNPVEGTEFEMVGVLEDDENKEGENEIEIDLGRIISKWAREVPRREVI